LNSGFSTDKKAEVVRLPPSIPAYPPKEVLEKLKFFGKEKEKKSMSINKVPQKQLYAQVAGLSVLDILKLKKNHPNLLAKKIKSIQKIINDSDKFKPQIKMTTKDLLYKQIIVPMGKDNVNNFMAFANGLC